MLGLRTLTVSQQEEDTSGSAQSVEKEKEEGDVEHGSSHAQTETNKLRSWLKKKAGFCIHLWNLQRDLLTFTVQYHDFVNLLLAALHHPEPPIQVMRLHYGITSPSSLRLDTDDSHENSFYTGSV